MKWLLNTVFLQLIFNIIFSGNLFCQQAEISDDATDLVDRSKEFALRIVSDGKAWINIKPDSKIKVWVYDEAEPIKGNFIVQNDSSFLLGSRVVHLSEVRKIRKRSSLTPLAIVTQLAGVFWLLNTAKKETIDTVFGSIGSLLGGSPPEKDYNYLGGLLVFGVGTLMHLPRTVELGGKWYLVIE